MLLSLSSHNVIQYLQDAGLCSSEDGASDEFELPKNHAKNVNLLVTLTNNRQLLVKQEQRHKTQGNPHDFFNEWLFHKLLEQFPVLGKISVLASSLLHFDEENSILVHSYLSEYLDLAKFYQTNDIFPTEIAAAIGTAVASLHSSTFQNRDHRDFMATAPQGQFRYNFYNPAQGIDSISPEIFGTIPTEALKFYTLYQRYESLEAAIADLAYTWHPCCLTHNDLNLNNILLHSRWEQLDNCLVKMIDWETCGWGDPAFDLGTLLASYLEIWLSSLIVDPTIQLEESQQLAMIPLEVIQPSILTLIRAYLHAFPVILEYRQDFIVRVIQFAGLALIHRIQDRIKYYKYFDNSDVHILHTAKNFLTLPEQSVFSLLGISEAEIMQAVVKSQKLPQPEKEPQLLRIFPEKTRLRGC
jgi:hypothetical protein